MKSSVHARFVVLDGLHLDRNVYDALSSWAAARGIRVQDAIQLAVCAYNDSARADAMHPTPSSSLRLVDLAQIE